MKKSYHSIVEPAHAVSATWTMDRGLAGETAVNLSSPYAASRSFTDGICTRTLTAFRRGVNFHSGFRECGSARSDQAQRSGESLAAAQTRWAASTAVGRATFTRTH